MSLQSKSKWVIPSKRKGDFLKYILKIRGVEDIPNFLEPSFSDIPNWDLLHGTKSASEKILDTVAKGGKIVIHGDYDADGICATALLWEFLYKELAKHLNTKIDVLPYIPNRIEQGYGLTKESLNDVIDLGASLLISVDCGVRDTALIHEYMDSKSLDFVITDHHQPPENMPEELKYPLVHQLYPNKEFPEKEICGTAVAFLLTQCIRESVGIPTVDPTSLHSLDLVALATVTDLMPLKGCNRVFVKYGIKQIQNSYRVGLRELSLKAGINPKEISSYHMGYILGPRINASGRIGSPMDAVRLLLSNDVKLCKDLAEKLNSLNFERQRITEEIFSIAKEQIKEDDLLHFVIGENWHEGVIGLVAGKLQEYTQRPVIIATNNEGEFKGSARSISSFNITNALSIHSEYLERYGGHALAAGFTAKGNTIDDFVRKIKQYARDILKQGDLIQKLKIDILLESSDITKDFILQLSSLEPYGYGNPKPLICLKDLIIFKKTILGKEANHLKLLVKGSGIDLLTAMLFSCNDDTEKLQVDERIDVVGFPDLNVWNGNESIQFMVKEWRYSS